MHRYLLPPTGLSSGIASGKTSKPFAVSRVVTTSQFSASYPSVSPWMTPHYEIESAHWSETHNAHEGALCRPAGWVSRAHVRGRRA